MKGVRGTLVRCIAQYPSSSDAAPPPAAGEAVVSAGDACGVPDPRGRVTCRAMEANRFPPPDRPPEELRCGAVRPDDRLREGAVSSGAAALERDVDLDGRAGASRLDETGPSSAPLARSRSKLRSTSSGDRDGRESLTLAPDFCERALATDATLANAAPGADVGAWLDVAA